MYRDVVKILRKHLDEAYQDYEQWEALSFSPYEVLCNRSIVSRNGRYESSSLRDCAKELIQRIKGLKASELVRIPSYDEAEKFAKTVLYLKNFDEPTDLDKAEMESFTNELLRWLKKL